MQRIGESVLKVLVYAFGLLFWAIAMLLVVTLLLPALRGRFEEHWLPATAIILCAAALLANLSRDFIKQGILKVVSLFKPTPPGGIVEIKAALPMAKEFIAMSENGKFVINNPRTINIQDNSTSHATNNNVQSGIIGSGTVHVHHHIEERKVEARDLRENPAASVPDKVADNDTIDINELLVFAEQLMKRPVARNTITKILERGHIESCGEVKIDKNWCNVYPRVRSKEAIAQWVADKAT